jgi:hypothetical protein
MGKTIYDRSKKVIPKVKKYVEQNIPRNKDNLY